MKILFICTGNICRSPAAEAILNKLLADNQLCGIYVKSAGTHERDNCPRDETMVNIAKEHGYHITGTSQTMTPDMLMEADLIIVMTERHYEDVTDLLDPPNGTKYISLWSIASMKQDHCTIPGLAQSTYIGPHSKLSKKDA